MTEKEPKDGEGNLLNEYEIEQLKQKFLPSI